MAIAFWYWFFMAIWAIWGIILGVRSRPAAGPYGAFYWTTGGTLLLFVLFVLIGLKDFPDPFGTLVHR
jgi:hypothetical protein